MPSTAPFSVQCPSCESWFPIDPERVPAGGVPAICSNCLRVFRVELPEAEAGDFPETDVPSVEVASREPTEDAPGEETPAEDEVAETAESEVRDVETALEDEEDARADATKARFEEPGPKDEEDAAAEVEEERALEDEAAREPDAGDTPSPVEPHSLSAAASRFGRRDPHDRARRLARVLVSDMLTYHPARYEKALAEGTLREDFEEEIRLSWEEYEEQIGGEIAESTDYFIRALNEILARGTTLFRGSGRPA